MNMKQFDTAVSTAYQANYTADIDLIGFELLSDANTHHVKPYGVDTYYLVMEYYLSPCYAKLVFNLIFTRKDGQDWSAGCRMSMEGESIQVMTISSVIETANEIATLVRHEMNEMDREER